MTSSPVTTCAGCGLCCTEMRTPPFIGNDSEYARLPFELREEIDQARAQPNRERPDGSPCSWLQADKTCKHYEHRPAICRDFKMGGAGCLAWRGEITIEGKPTA